MITRASRSIRGLYAIVDLDLAADPLALADAVLAGGAQVVQLRAKGREKGDLLALADSFAERCLGAGALFIVNDHIDLALAVKADGVHLGQHDLPVRVARRLMGSRAIIGCSTNTVEEAQTAQDAGADYVGVGAMFATSSKSDTRPAGLARLAEIREVVSIPIVAIGGIDETNAAGVIAAGANAIAIIGALSRSPDPTETARRLASLVPEPAGIAPTEMSNELERLIAGVRVDLADKYRARERGLLNSREVIRASANTIRAVHRGDFSQAREILAGARHLLDLAADAMGDHGEIRYAGFLQDAEKEFAEASLTLALVAGDPLPDPETLGVGSAPYLNGLGETVGELRREVLDLLRRDNVERSESLLQVMDDIYSLLVTIDYPDAMTGSLRRTTDNVRGILERTRGDLTTAIRQRRLEARLAALDERLNPES